MKKKKRITLRQVLIYDLLVIMGMMAFMFIVETRVTEYRQRENLIERLNSIQETFDDSYKATNEVTEIYNDAQLSKLYSLIYVLNRDPDLPIDNELKKIYGLSDIIVGPYRKEQGFRYYTSTTDDGRMITIEKSSHDLDVILNNIYTDNKVLQRITQMDDLFFIVTTSNGRIVYYPVEEYIGEDISTLGIKQSDLVEDDAKWLRIDKKYYYTSSIQNKNLGITISCGITSNDMTLNSHIANGLIFFITSIIFTIILVYIYFAKQYRQRRENDENYSYDTVVKKMTIFSLIGLLMIGTTSYYVNTLFQLALHSLATDNEVAEIRSSYDEAGNAVEQLTEQYNASYLNKAQITSHILSTHPEFRTREHLAALSEIMDYEFIILYDKQGKEIISDSYIVDFEISSNPDDQSYAFNVLKNGVPYVIQPAQEDELTGTYRQYIGVLTYDENGEMDGFMQVALSPSKLKTLTDEADLDVVLDSAIAGTDDEVFAIDTGTLTFTHAASPELIGMKATDYGFKENQLKNNFFGYVTVQGTKYYMNSFELENKYIYIGNDVDDIFDGRILLTSITQILAIINMVFVTMYMRNREPVPDDNFDENLYVNVEMGDGQNKTTLNAITRLMRQRVEWSNKTPEDKTGIIIRTIVGTMGTIILLLLPLRGKLYTENSIFGFVVSGRWERGINIFAMTQAISIIFIYTMVISLAEILLNQIIKFVNPKSETFLRLLKSFVRYVGAIALGYFCLSILGFDSQSLLASAGLLTLVVGLGAKDLVTDILAGIFIIFENEFQVGDIIEVAGYKGRVVEIGIRTTRLVNTTMDVKSINNRNLTNIVNKTRNNTYCDVIINVPFDQNIEAIESMLRAELPKIKDLSPYIIDGPNYGGIDDMGGRTIRISIRTECLESYKFEVRTVVNREIKILFEKNGFKLM